MAARICLLGGAGFLGSHLVQALLARTDVELTVLDSCMDRLDALSSPRLRRIQARVTDAEALQHVLQGADPVLSLTALCNPSLYNTRPRQVIDASFGELVPLVDRCTAHGTWLIHFSTCEVYGRPWPDGAPMSEATTPLVLGPVQRERWTYACAKQLLERLIWAEQRHGGLRATIVRPFNVIGPRMDFIPGVDGEGVPRVLACFMDALLRQRPLRLVRGGGQRRSFLAVQELCDAVLRVIARPDRCQGEILNLGNPQNDVTIAELAWRMVAIHAERHGGDAALPCEPISAEELYGAGYDDADLRIPDIARARQLLDWRPVKTLEQMLPPIIDDYVARYGGRVA